MSQFENEGSADAVDLDFNTLPPTGRRQTLLRDLRRAHQICPGPVTIVETGTTRDDREVARDGDGWATVALGWLASKTGGKAITVDIDPAAIEICKRITSHQAESIEYVVSDSIKFFQSWFADARGLIHLLYLDSVDYTDAEASKRGNGESGRGDRTQLLTGLQKCHGNDGTACAASFETNLRAHWSL